MSTFREIVADAQELRALVGWPSARALQKERLALDDHCRAFIAHSPYVLIATSSADGRCDVSPKGDAPGFVVVLDDRRLVIPDRPGNNRLDSLQNLLENPQIGLLFLVPGREETLRVNGRAVITRDPECLQQSVVPGKQPLLGIGVEVEQCYLHCGKASHRARLWAHEHWLASDALPPLARVLFDQLQPADVTVEEFARALEERSRASMY